MEILTDMYLVLEPVLATLLYATIGIVVMMISVVAFDKLFGLDLHRELVEDQNMAFGVMLAGVAIGIGLIISASITG